MNRIRSIFRRERKSKPQRSSKTPTENCGIHDVDDPQCHAQLEIQHHPPISGATSIEGSSGPPHDHTRFRFNDAPIDLLSIHFTGRKSELARISTACTSKGRRDIPLCCALYGSPGVGKTQLTYAWAKSTFSRGENDYIIWISSTTVEKLYQGFCRLLQLVNHPDRSDPDQNVQLATACRWLEAVDSGNWLLVLDNVVPETLGFLSQHLPRRNGRGTILITTRTKQVAVAVAGAAGGQHTVIQVPMLSVEGAVKLFLAHFRDEQAVLSSAKVEAIAKAAGCLPLAIPHAAGYLGSVIPIRS